MKAGKRPVPVMEDYKSPPRKHQVSAANKQRYLGIYQDYVENSLTFKEVAERHDISVDNVSKIIKWSTFYLGKTFDSSAYRQVIHDRAMLRNQKLEGILPTAKGAYDKVVVLKEMRANDRLVAQAHNALGSSGSEGKGPTTINVQVNSGLNRGAGVETVRVDGGRADGQNNDKDD